MKVGIIGAGTMGSGIAQAFAQTEGYEVFLCDINEEFAANGKKKIAKGFEKRIAKGKMTQETADAVLAKITTGVKTICEGAGKWHDRRIFLYGRSADGCNYESGAADRNPVSEC